MENKQLEGLIVSTPFLNETDKGILINNLNNLSPLEKLKLRHNLMSGVMEPVTEQINLIKKNFAQNLAQSESKDKPKPNIISQVASKIAGSGSQKKLLSGSVLSIPGLLGGPTPKPAPTDNVQPLKKITDIYHPAQLAFLQNSHVDFNINQNGDQEIRVFLDKISQIMDKIQDPNQKRTYLMNYLQSSLFKSYINTGLTALRHPEMEPHKIILNLLNQINPNYLSNRQFRYASLISNNLRILCAV